MEKECRYCKHGRARAFSTTFCTKVSRGFSDVDHCDYWEPKEHEQQIKDNKIRDELDRVARAQHDVWRRQQIEEEAKQKIAWQKQFNNNSYGKNEEKSHQKSPYLIDLTEIKDKGFVYILTNRAIPEYVKIGKTTKLPETRAAELSTSTGVPIPYQVYHAILVRECSFVETKLHEKLKGCRENSGREFFRISPDIAKAVMLDLVQEYEI